MTSKQVIFLIIALVIIGTLIRFLIFLYGNSISGKRVEEIPINFPICRDSKQPEAILKIQKALNKTKQTFYTPLLVEDGVFGPKTEWELKNQTQSICVSNPMYYQMV